MTDKILKFEPYRDNSMGRNSLRFRFEFLDFTFRESKAVSDEAIKLAARLADQLEKDLKDFE